MSYHVSVFMLCWRSKFFTLILFWYISSVCVCVYVRANENRTSFHRVFFFSVNEFHPFQQHLFLCANDKNEIYKILRFLSVLLSEIVFLSYSFNIFFLLLSHSVRTCSTEHSIEVSNNILNWFPCKHKWNCTTPVSSPK